jgi:hypothetical protein
MLEWIRMRRHREVVGHSDEADGAVHRLLFSHHPAGLRPPKDRCDDQCMHWFALINHSSTERGTRQMNSIPSSRREISFIQWLLGVFSVHTEP